MRFGDIEPSLWPAQLYVWKVDYCSSVLASISGHQLESTDYSPSWTPRRDWFSRQEIQTTQLHCAMISIGFKSRSGSSSGTAPSYLFDSLRRCAETLGRRCLRWSFTDTGCPADEPVATWRVGGRAFPVAASRAWNGLPASVRTATSLHSFIRQLKTFLYRQSFC